VDENGNYERILGPQLYGKSVLNEGNKLVLEMYKKHVVHTFDYTHSYPYDWRTKKVRLFLDFI
jgi:isoleucyl-tRNA synthetase